MNMEVGMGYSVEHKAHTRERIVQSAARLFRRYGYNGVGIDDIMAAAQLTRGGFYAHFRSKRDLFFAALAEELELARQLRRGDAGNGEGSGSARALIDFYLDSANRKHVPSMCSLVSLSADVARGGEEASAAYTAALRDLIAALAERIPATAPEARARACAAVALCVGGAVLAQAVSDDALAEPLLEACRARALAEIEGE
jgi:TetR/AcrR family transcriptional regulator, transcriptional repressor for nem operon